MGLDMYLSAEKYLGNWGHSEESEKKAFNSVIESIGFDLKDLPPDSPSLTVNVSIGYWRKANHIHDWLVNNCAGGVDDCRPVNVGGRALAELRSLCLEAIATKNAALLKPCEGFFFGGTGIDDDYWQDLAATVEIIDRAIRLSKRGYGIGYRASW